MIQVYPKLLNKSQRFDEKTLWDQNIYVFLKCFNIKKSPSFSIYKIELLVQDDRC